MTDTNLTVHALRLLPHDDLKLSLIRFTQENKLTAGFIITCVGSLIKTTLRLANAKSITHYEGEMEIVSLTGTLSQDGVHLHISLADTEGATIGGHLMEGCIINTTAEIILGNAHDYQFTRELDPKTNFKELIIKTLS